MRVLWMPMRRTNGQLITQWSGGECDDAGFLKNDILGLKQLSKFTDILNLAKENGKDVPDIYNLPYDDREVFRFFSNGWTGDIFQMGSEGLTSYVKNLKPQNLDDVRMRGKLLNIIGVVKILQKTLMDF